MIEILTIGGLLVAWSRKSAMFASLAIALYLLGLVLRNQQLVTVAVVLLSFLT